MGPMGEPREAAGAGATVRYAKTSPTLLVKETDGAFKRDLLTLLLVRGCARSGRALDVLLEDLNRGSNWWFYLGFVGIGINTDVAKMAVMSR